MVEILGSMGPAAVDSQRREAACRGPRGVMNARHFDVQAEIRRSACV